MKVKILGYERNRGFSQKKNANYDYHIIHTCSTRPLTSPGCSGFSVQTVIVAESQGVLSEIPNPGQIWEISYNRQGKVDDAYKLED